MLILTDSSDTHADAIEQELSKENALAFRLNLDKSALLETHLSFDGENATIETHKGIISSTEIGVVWPRRAFVEMLPDDEDRRSIDTRIWRGEWDRSLLGLYLALRGHPWVSELPSCVRAENKLFQLAVARESNHCPRVR